MTASPDATAPEREQVRRFADWVHHLVLAATLLLRPFVFGGDYGATDQTLWNACVLLGWTLLVLEWSTGLRRDLRWGPSGIAAIALVVALVPAAVLGPEPSQAWSRWGSWALVLAWAGYLCQVLPERLRFAWSLMIATLGCELILALVQHQVVLPQMRESLAEEGSELAVLAERHGAGAVGERIASGGVYGTFILANTLAAWLLLMALPLAGSVIRGVRAWRDRHERAVPVGGLVVVAILLGVATVALSLTGARGAPAAAVVAGGVVFWRWGPARWRSVPLLLLALAAVALVVVPALADPVRASVEVRLGYWRAAWMIVVDHWLLGSGIGGFEALAGLHLRPQDEFSRFAHNEWIEAGVSGGLLALAAATVCFGFLVWRRPPPPAPEGDDASTPARVVRWLPLVLFPYALVYGTFRSDHLGWWPGGDGALVAFYALGLGAVTAWIAVACRRLPLPPAWAGQLAIATAILACALDFHLHDLGLLGGVAAMACVVGAPGLRRCRMERRGTILAGLVLGVAVVGCVLGTLRATELQRVDRIAALLDGHRRAVRSGDAQASWAHLHDLALVADLPPPPREDHEAASGAILATAWQQAEESLAGWPSSPRRRYALALRHPDPAVRSEQLERVVAARRHDAPAWSALARASLASGDLARAEAAARRAVAVYPAHLQYRLELAAILEAIAARRRVSADQRRSEAQAIRQAVEAIRPRAHPSHQPLPRSRADDPPARVESGPLHSPSR